MKDHYKNGRRWGYGVAKASIEAGGSNVHKADKAMRTCAQNARTGTKKLSKNERDAYRGMFDGMYDAFKQSERVSAPKQSASSAKKAKKKKPFQYNYQTKVKGGYTVDGKFELD